MRVQCGQCGSLATTHDKCPRCGSDHPMQHWHGEEPFAPEKVHAHPHDGFGHDHGDEQETET